MRIFILFLTIFFSCSQQQSNEHLSIFKYNESSGIHTLDPAFSKDHIERLFQIFPKEWCEKINFIPSTSQQALPEIKESFDLIYIDGDHTYEAVKSDWQMTKDKYSKFLLFDDYHLPTKDSGPGIQVSKLIDEIQDDTKELIIMDRRVFLDDRGYTDDMIDYGQVLLTNSSFDTSKFIKGW